MSEQTDPLAQLILDHRERHPLVGICRCGDFDVHDGYPSHLADAIRAAVLADPTIVGMERVVAEDIVPADLPDRIVTYISECRITPPPDWQTAAREAVRTVAEAHQWDDLYRTPEVKG